MQAACFPQAPTRNSRNSAVRKAFLTHEFHLSLSKRADIEPHEDMLAIPLNK
jgi:hypothetical protein